MPPELDSVGKVSGAFEEGGMVIWGRSQKSAVTFPAGNGAEGRGRPMCWGRSPRGKGDLPQKGGGPSPGEVAPSGARARFRGEGPGAFGEGVNVIWGRPQKSAVTFPAESDTEGRGRPMCWGRSPGEKETFPKRVADLPREKWLRVAPELDSVGKVRVRLGKVAR